ncbi:uncharacterized protein N7473_009117 [Penicillium subrubescens]|uniref:uncharacterized protein n=1 Tax=Penicillium subrubescens TaxID=1316194 RepID=UPI00254517ED|nr:uncharacterized protein N7473_009117 [Penicillium subrubescens]KAJ5886443.1 hypothetical protein N7473_009117 [Penicillium subrubescens]
MIDLAGGWDLVIVIQESLSVDRFIIAFHLLVPFGTFRHVDRLQAVVLQALQTFDSLPLSIEEILERLSPDEEVTVTTLADTIKLVQLGAGIVLGKISIDIIRFDNEDLIQLPATANGKHIELLGDTVQVFEVLSPILLNVVCETTPLEQFPPAIRFIKRLLRQWIADNVVGPLPDAISGVIFDLRQTRLQLGDVVHLVLND